VVAPIDLVVISINPQWKKGSGLRGGRYVWALSPSEDLLFYFAHLDSVSAAGGAFCRAGEKIGTVGRTGKNAALRTSKTHLHMMVLKVTGNTLTPLDFYPRLSTSRR
jgi:peptidoglycan LD-endopeptidase LytH